MILPTEIPPGHPLYATITNDGGVRMEGPILYLDRPVPIDRFLGPVRFVEKDGKSKPEGWRVQVLIDETAWFAEVF